MSGEAPSTKAPGEGARQAAAGGLDPQLCAACLRARLPHSLSASLAGLCLRTFLAFELCRGVSPAALAPTRIDSLLVRQERQASLLSFAWRLGIMTGGTVASQELQE